MNKIKILLITLLLMFSFWGCSNNSPTKIDENKKIEIVVTVFPAYDWIRELIKGKEDQIELTLLINHGVDMHSYQPSTDDLIKIANCDVFVYIGGESDQWVETTLKNETNENRIVLNLMELLAESLIQEELLDGSNHEGHSHELEYDEHIWLSLKNAQHICTEITKILTQVSPENTDSWVNNNLKYQEELAQLDQEYAEVIANSDVNTLLFGDRFPFRYLIEDYGLNYYAAFSGCSAETEASFEAIAFLASKIDELELDYVLVIENGNYKLAQTIINNTQLKNQEIIELNSLQSIISEKQLDSISYLEVMKENLKQLTIVLQ